MTQVPTLLSLSQQPPFRIRIVLADFAAVAPCVRSEHPDVFELLNKIDQHVGSNYILLDRFPLVDVGYLARLD